jgi:hypothetical protein
MDLKKLTDKFLVDDNMTPDKLGEQIEKLLTYCIVRKNGTVDILAGEFSGKDLVKLVLSARLLASKIVESPVSSEVTAEEIAEFTGLPKNQAVARAKEIVDEKFAERNTRGSYKARPHKVDRFIAELPLGKGSKGDQ